MIITCLDSLLETLKYWVGVQQGQPYLIGKSCLLAWVGHASSDVYISANNFMLPLILSVFLSLLNFVYSRSQLTNLNVEKCLTTFYPQ